MIKGMGKDDNKSVNFFFSHYNEGKNMTDLLNETIAGLNGTESLNTVLCTVLRKMRELGN